MKNRSKKMRCLLLLLLIDLTIIESSHFNGGSITWSPVNPSSTSSPVLITITQTYSWMFPDVKCDVNVPTSTGNWLYGTAVLTCVANCTTDGDYSSKPINSATDCISSSASIGIMTSQRSVLMNLTAGAHFTLAYRSFSWRSIGNVNSGMPGWSIASLIDLRIRPDGIINSPPIASVASPQYVIVGRTTRIRIPVRDVNEDDDLRCRWAQKTGSATFTDECDDVCPTTGFPSGTTLSNCTLTFTGTTSGIWYVISVQVEDFIDTSSTIPLSSVPIQFLVYVMPNLICSELPVILPLTTCLEVQVGQLVNITLFAMNDCNRTRTIVTDIMDTTNINGMQLSNLTNSTTNTSLSFVTITWTPQTNQIGSQQLCALAYTNEQAQSEEYCVTFIVRNISNFCRTTTMTTTSTTSQTTTSTTTTSTTTTTTSTHTTTTTTTSVTTTSTTATSTTTSTTTTSTTSVTTTTTTSITTTTERTTPATSNINIPLIVSLSIVGFLAALCCSLYLLYSLLCKRKRRRVQKNARKFKDHIYSVSDGPDVSRQNGNETNPSLSKKWFKRLSFATDDGPRSSGIERQVKSKHTSIPIHSVNEQHNKRKIHRLSSNRVTVVTLSEQDRQLNEDSKINQFETTYVDEHTNIEHNQSKTDQDILISTRGRSMTNADDDINNWGRRQSGVSIITVTKIKRVNKDIKLKATQSNNDRILNDSRKKDPKIRVIRLPSKRKASVLQSN